jgi:hypothetical protein
VRPWKYGQGASGGPQAVDLNRGIMPMIFPQIHVQPFSLPCAKYGKLQAHAGQALLNRAILSFS